MQKPKILIFDIETAPMTVYTWGLYKQNIGLNQIKHDWYLLMWAAKWYGDPAKKVMQMNNSKAKDVRNDKDLIIVLWKLLDETDVIVTQNGNSFDVKKFNARALFYGLPPPSPFRSIDLLVESRKVFGLTSHKLEYMSEKFNRTYKKLKHKEYPGFELWKEVLNGVTRAWKVMIHYCIRDVLATEELFTIIQGWIKGQNLALYADDEVVRCLCGSDNLVKWGFAYTGAGKFQGYKCKSCGARPRGRTNLLSTKKKRNLLK